MILFTRHVACEGPALLGEVLDQQRRPYRVLDVEPGCVWPEPEALEALVVMGGPQSATDLALAGELKMIERCLKARLPILGVCLGSQLLARALGAGIKKNPSMEIGWAPLHLKPDAAADPLFSAVPDKTVVFHWHGETFDLPTGASWLASSDQCVHQAFAWDHRAWGLQFHLEVRPFEVREWVREYPEDFKHYMGEDVEKELAVHQGALAEVCRKVFHVFLETKKGSLRA